MCPNGGVEIFWPDGLTSNFQPQWLRERAWVDKKEQEEKILWDSQYQLKKYQYNEILKSDSAMLQWLKDLSTFGLTVVENSPRTPTSLEILQKKIGTAKSTHFGSFWNVQTKPNAMNLAYTSARLGLHLDLPFYEYTPGVQFLQCIMQYKGEGGANEFVDAFAVAEKMRKDCPNEFKILSDTQVHFWDAGSLDVDGDTEQTGKFHKRHSASTFQLDNQHRLIKVFFNNQVKPSRI